MSCVEDMNMTISSPEEEIFWFLLITVVGAAIQKSVCSLLGPSCARGVSVTVHLTQNEQRLATGTIVSVI